MSLFGEHTEYYERIFPFREEVFGFLRRHLSGDDRRVLDVGCGPGHYTGRFADAGHEAIGIDLEEEMISFARGKYPQAGFEALDMIDIRQLTGPFDLAFCIGNAAANLTAPEFTAVAEGLKGLLRPNSAWIVQTVNWDYVMSHAGHRFPPKILEDGAVEFHREYHNVSPDRASFRTRLVVNGELVHEGESVLHPVSASEYVQLHERNGYNLHGHYADFAETPFEPGVWSGSVLVFRRA